MPEGIEIRSGKRRESLRITFYFNGVRCRETLDIPVTPANIKYACNLRGEIKNQIERGTFDYAKMFPASKRACQKALNSHRYKVGELVDEYIDAARKTKSLSPSSISTYVKWQRARLKPQWGDRFVDEVTTTEIRAWIVELIAKLAPKSVRNCVGLLSSVLTRALNDEQIKCNPLSPISLKSMMPKRKKASEEDKVDPFNAAEIAAIFNACKRKHEKALFQFAFSTGMRTGELIAIKWRHIDWINGMIRVEDNIVSGECGTVEKTTKTDVERDIPLLPAARSALEIMRPITGMLKNGDYIFTGDGKNRWRDDSHVRERWVSIIKLAKVRYRKPYQTRHTFASTLLMNGEPELLVAKLLGHSTVEMIRRIYGKYIKQPGGITLRSDYSEFGADKGQLSPNNAALNHLAPFHEIAGDACLSTNKRRLKAV